jgi:flagellar biogenesis protein FliO
MLGSVVFASLALFTPHKTPVPVDQGLQAVISLADPSQQVQLPPLPGKLATSPKPGTQEASKKLNTEPTLSSIVMKLSFPLLILCGLLGAAAIFRRKKIFPSTIKVVESVALGKSRNLVIADVAGKRMLIGSSEAGISLLADDVPIDFEATASQESANTLTEQFGGPANAAAGLLNRLRGPKRKAEESFDSHLSRAPSPSFNEGDELRAKLAARLGGKAA